MLQQPYVDQKNYLAVGKYKEVVTRIGDVRSTLVYPHANTAFESMEGELVAVITDASESAIREFLIGFLGLPDTVAIKFE